MEKGWQHLEKFLVSSSLTVLSPEQLLKCATSAAGANGEIGRLVVEAFEKVGPHGLVQVVPADEQESRVEVEGSNTFNTRFPCPYCAGQQEALKVVFEAPFILLTNHEITSPSAISHLLDKLLPTERPLLIITNFADAEVLPAFVLNHEKGIARVSVLRAPKSLVSRDESHEGLALLTGGRMINREKGERLEDIDLDDLGAAARLEAGKDFTAIEDGRGSAGQLEERINRLSARLSERADARQKKQLKERLAFLSGGHATIYLAASSAQDFKEKKAKAEKAIHASRAALAEGVVPGAGLAFVRAYETLQPVKGDNPDQHIQQAALIDLQALKKNQPENIP